MVDGPNGDFSMGKDYWNKQANDKGYEYDSSKNAPKKAIKIPIGQKSEAMKIIKQKYSAEEIAHLAKKIDKIIAQNGEYIETSVQPTADFGTVNHTTRKLNAILDSIPPEVRDTLKTKEDILNYIKTHQNSIGVSEDSKQKTPEYTPDKYDMTSQVEEDGKRHYYIKTKDQGEDGWKNIDDIITPELYRAFYEADMPED